MRWAVFTILACLAFVPAPSTLTAEESVRQTGLDRAFELQRELSQAEQPGGFNSVALLDRHSMTVSWYHDLSGDYDQNGEVNIADLTPLTRHFGESAVGSWEDNSIQEVLDGDGNREINLADITVIARFFGNRIDGFELFLAEGTEHVAFSPGAGEFHVGMEERTGDPLVERLRFQHSFHIGPSPFYYLQAVTDGQLVGEPSLARESLPHPPRLHTPHFALSWDSDQSELKWYPDLHGDGDGNGEVNVSDLAAIAVHFAKAGPFEPGSQEWHTDYDGNGEINAADIHVILLNKGATTSGYAFYATADLESLTEPYSYPVLEPVAVSGDFPDWYQQESIEWNNLPKVSGTYIWMRPYDGDYNDPVNCGAPSEIIQIP